MLAGHARNHERASGCLSEGRRKNLAIESGSSKQGIQHTWWGWHCTHLFPVFECAASAVCCRCGLYEIRPSIFNEGELSRCREHRRGIWRFAWQDKSHASQKCVTQLPFSFFVKLDCLKKNLSSHTRVTWLLTPDLWDFARAVQSSYLPVAAAETVLLFCPCPCGPPSRLLFGRLFLCGVCFDLLLRFAVALLSVCVPGLFETRLAPV